MAAKKSEAKIQVPVKLMEGGALPCYITDGAAGADLYAAVDYEMNIKPGWMALVPLAFQAAIPEGLVGFIVPRSGIALKDGITVLNSPGAIDSDYRGEWKVLLINHSNKLFNINKGDRIAQIIYVEAKRVEHVVVDELPDTERGSGGFGHTGV